MDGERWGGPSDRYELESVCGRPLGLRLVRRALLVPSGDPSEMGRSLPRVVASGDPYP